MFLFLLLYFYLTFTYFFIRAGVISFSLFSMNFLSSFILTSFATVILWYAYLLNNISAFMNEGTKLEVDLKFFNYWNIKSDSLLFIDLKVVNPCCKLFRGSWINERVPKFLSLSSLGEDFWSSLLLSLSKNIFFVNIKSSRVWKSFDYLESFGKLDVFDSLLNDYYIKLI